jgi:hypothetical protein
MNATIPIPLKKITTADVYAYGRPKGEEKLRVPDKYMLLLYVYGAVASAIVKPSKFDENQQVLIGRFEAVRVSDNQKFTSEQLYLPNKDYQTQLANACQPSADGVVNEPEFGFMIGYMAGNSPTGYVFSCEPLTDTRIQDRLANVRKLVSDTDILKRFNLPALAAPVAQEVQRTPKK